MKYLLVFLVLFSASFSFAQTAPATNLTAKGTWTAPTEREGLDPLTGKPMLFDATKELGGYIVRYRKVGTSAYTETRVAAGVTSLEIILPYAAYEMGIQAFDKNGLYSNWLDLPAITPPANSNPKAPGNFKVTVTPERLIITSGSK